uniref:Putative secreted protein n=1 Tax=Anopheles darlingi TaxID=43151 RepID=A0A2M4DA37_ANODA
MGVCVCVCVLHVCCTTQVLSEGDYRDLYFIPTSWYRNKPHQRNHSVRPTPSLCLVFSRSLSLSHTRQ